VEIPVSSFVLHH